MIDWTINWIWTNEHFNCVILEQWIIALGIRIVYVIIVASVFDQNELLSVAKLDLLQIRFEWNFQLTEVFCFGGTVDPLSKVNEGISVAPQDDQLVDGSGKGFGHLRTINFVSCIFCVLSDWEIWSNYLPKNNWNENKKRYCSFHFSIRY